MVDAFVQGIKSLPSRVNPQSLHPIAFNALRELRQSFLEKKKTGPWVGQIMANSLKEIQQKDEEKFMAVMVELVTVVLLAGRDAQVGLEPVFRYIFLGAIKAMQELNFESERIELMLEQLLIAVFMTPAYDFEYAHYQRLAFLIKRLTGEILALRFLRCFSDITTFRLIHGIGEGFLNCLEIIEVDAVQKEDLKAIYKKPMYGYFGYYDCLIDYIWLADPLWVKKLQTKFNELKQKISFKKQSK
ncbi:MAG: hypothetical protein KKA19_01605 [Candidatus Margulisbacteria bacterium]|nr:hypothetical protein [Candidatus Margulisiibacteriota bacterium]